MTPVRLEPVAPRSRVKDSTTEPLRSLFDPIKIWQQKRPKYISQTSDTRNLVMIILSSGLKGYRTWRGNSFIHVNGQNLKDK